MCLDFPACIISILFSLYWSGAHQDLHSFPTRRSSDLHPAWLSLCAANRGASSRPETRRENVRPAKDRKSTRLNSSHVSISYAVFCLKKKKNSNHLPLSRKSSKSRWNLRATTPNSCHEG